MIEKKKGKKKRAFIGSNFCLNVCIFQFAVLQFSALFPTVSLIFLRFTTELSARKSDD